MIRLALIAAVIFSLPAPPPKKNLKTGYYTIAKRATGDTAWLKEFPLPVIIKSDTLKENDIVFLQGTKNRSKVNVRVIRNSTR